MHNNWFVHPLPEPSSIFRAPSGGLSSCTRDHRQPAPLHSQIEPSCSAEVEQPAHDAKDVLVAVPPTAKLACQDAKSLQTCEVMLNGHPQHRQEVIVSTSQNGDPVAPLLLDRVFHQDVRIAFSRTVIGFVQTNPNPWGNLGQDTGCSEHYNIMQATRQPGNPAVHQKRAESVPSLPRSGSLSCGLASCR